MAAPPCKRSGPRGSAPSGRRTGAYSLLRSAGLSSVSALVLSGAFPALGIVAGLARHRRVDAIGVLVLAGIAVGTILGLVSGNARLVLVEGSVPTAVFGLLCLGSLWSRRPLIFRFALEFMGADTPRGRDFDGLWQYPGFRHAFRLFTVVWGVAYLAEAAARVIIVETTSTATALAVSKVMPYAVAAVLAGWMFAYGRRARREGERIAAAAEAGAERDAAPAEHGARPAEHAIPETAGMAAQTRQLSGWPGPPGRPAPRGGRSARAGNAPQTRSPARSAGRPATPRCRRRGKPTALLVDRRQFPAAQQLARSRIRPVHRHHGTDHRSRRVRLVHREISRIHASGQPRVNRWPVGTGSVIRSTRKVRQSSWSLS